MNPTLCIFIVTLLTLLINIPTSAGSMISLLIPVPTTPFEKIARRAKHFPKIIRCNFVPEEPTIDEETEEQIKAEKEDSKKPNVRTETPDPENTVLMDFAAGWL